MQELRIKCPYHTMSADDDLSIDLETGRWVCHICKESGNDVNKLEKDLTTLEAEYNLTASEATKKIINLVK